MKTLLLLSLFWILPAGAVPPDVKLESITKVKGDVALEFSRGNPSADKKAPREKVVLKDDDGVATLAVIQAMLLEKSDHVKDQKLVEPKNLFDETKHVREILIAAARRAEENYQGQLKGLMSSRRKREKAEASRVFNELTELQKIRQGFESAEKKLLSFGQLDDLGKWLQRNIDHHNYDVYYTTGEKTTMKKSVKFFGPNPFLSGSFTMRRPPFRLKMESVLGTKPNFEPNLKEIGAGYEDSGEAENPPEHRREQRDEKQKDQKKLGKDSKKNSGSAHEN